VIEAGDASCWRIGESIPPATNRVLRDLGVWDAFLAQDHLPSAGTCASWGKQDLGYNDFIVDRQGKGWHLDRAAFDRMLAAEAEARGVAFLRGRKLADAEAAQGGFALVLEDASGARSCIEARFLVDATGIAASAVRRLGVARNQLDCLAVLSAVFALADPERLPSQALLEACESGWWYAAKLPGARMIAALAVDPAERHRRAAPGDWQAALRKTAHLSQWLDRGGADTALPPATALAPSAILSRVVGKNWLAVGDAASAYDPISSLGIHKALGDGLAAGRAIAESLTSGKAPLLAYQEGVFARFRDYWNLRGHLYAQERRWPAAPFWRARQAG